MYMLQSILVPIFICVVLPVMVVWLICRATINSDNKRAQVLIEAIRHNKDIETDALAKAFAKKRKSFQRIQLRRLLNGCILSLVGFSLFITNLVVLNINDYWETDEFIAWLFISVICFAVGISFLIVYFVGRKSPEDKESN